MNIYIFTLLFTVNYTIQQYKLFLLHFYLHGEILFEESH
jgi:hypothetical protein